MKEHILVSIALFCILFHRVASDTSAQLYGSVLNPYQLQVFEDKDITLSLSSIDFPAIKTIIGQKGPTPALCKIQNSLPDIEELQSLVLPTDKSLVQLASIYNFTYLIYNDISIDVLQPIWNTQKNTYNLQNVTSVSKPSGLSDTFEQAEVIFSQEKEIFQVWTKDRIFMFDWDSSQAALSFIQSESIPAGMKGIETWTKHQTLNDYVYFLYSDTPNKIIATKIDASYTTPVSTEILLTDSAPAIIDFYATNEFLYVAQQNAGVHVYHYNMNTSSWNKTDFVAQTGIQSVTGNNYIFAAVSQELVDQFEVTEYTINSSGLYTYQKNSNRVFPRNFTGTIQVDETRIMLLNQNVMFVWYHSIPETAQQDREKLINSFVFYGQTDFIVEPNSNSNSFIYADSGDQVKLYQLSDKSPEIHCPIKDLKSTQASEIYYNLEFTGVTCPIKTKLQDHSPENICLYRQELVIKLSGEAFSSIKWGWVVLIGFGFSIVIIGLGVAIYYIMKNRKENQYVRERLYLLKEDKPKESGGNTGRSPRSFFNDVSVGGESFAPFRHGDRTEIKDDTSFTKGNLEGRILPTRMDETLRSGLSNSPNKIDLEETDSPVREEKDSKNVLKPQKSQMEDDYRETAKTASINLDILMK